MPCNPCPQPHCLPPALIPAHPAAVTMATCTLARMSAMMCRIISLSCSMCAPSAYSVPSASKVIRCRLSALACTCGAAGGGRRAASGLGCRASAHAPLRLRARDALYHLGAQLSVSAHPSQGQPWPALPTCAMLRMCRISAKLGGTYWRRESAKNSSYSWNASTSLRQAVSGEGLHVWAGCRHRQEGGRCWLKGRRSL